MSSYLVSFALLLVKNGVKLGVVLLGLIWWNQDKLLYLPSFGGKKEQRFVCYNPNGFRNPAEQGLPGHSYYLDTKDGHQIHLWLIADKSTFTRPTVIMFHGNAGNIGTRLPFVRALYHRVGCNVAMVEYRGYGNSTGTPNQNVIVSDAELILKFLRGNELVNNNKIVAYGRSLGGAVAIKLATGKCGKYIKGLVVENTFTSIPDMGVILAQRIFGSVNGLAKKFIFSFASDKWNSLASMRHLRMSSLFISGLKDELVPPQHMRELYDTARQHSSQEALFLPVAEGDHNSTFISGINFYAYIIYYIVFIIIQEQKLILLHSKNSYIELVLLMLLNQNNNWKLSISDIYDKLLVLIIVSIFMLTSLIWQYTQ